MVDSDTTFLEKVTEAHGDYIRGEYVSALEKFTKLIDSAKTYDYNLLIYRAYTNWKLNRTTAMLDDAERAVSLAGGRYEALYLKSIGLMYKSKFTDALKEINKCKQLTSDLSSTDPRRLDISKWEKIINDEFMRSPVADQALSAGKVNYEWRQTETKVYIEILFAVEDKSEAKVRFENERCEVFFPLSEYKSFELNLDLNLPIVPDQSKYIVHTEKLEIQLEKKEKSKWPMLEKDTSKNEQVLEEDGPKMIQSKVKGGPKGWKGAEKVGKDGKKTIHFTRGK